MKVEQERLDKGTPTLDRGGKPVKEKDKPKGTKPKDIKDILDEEGNAVKASKKRPGRLPRLTKEDPV